MIVTDGGRFGGYALFLSKGELGIGRGKPVFLYNLLDLKRTTWEGPELGAGQHTIAFDFKSDGPGLGKGGTGVLYVDGQEVARNSLEHSTPVTFPEDETFDIGQDTRTGVAMLEYRYDVPFKFTGNINTLTFKLEPEPGQHQALAANGFSPYSCKVWNVTVVCHCLTRGKSSICIRPPPRQAVRTVREASFTTR